MKQVSDFWVNSSLPVSEKPHKLQTAGAKQKKSFCGSAFTVHGKWTTVTQLLFSLLCLCIFLKTVHNTKDVINFQLSLLLLFLPSKSNLDLGNLLVRP